MDRRRLNSNGCCDDLVVVVRASPRVANYRDRLHTSNDGLSGILQDSSVAKYK